MDEMQWKLDVSSRLAKIESGLEDIKERLPVCEKANLKNQIKSNRRLVYLILVTYLPLLVIVITSIIK